MKLKTLLKLCPALILIASFCAKATVIEKPAKDTVTQATARNVRLSAPGIDNPIRPDRPSVPLFFTFASLAHPISYHNV
ncbi:MAG: hypothetical protein QNJ40_12110 [Xanthomonadales bacterium]|nr:hypothetical protein [Xanthomonadales bacterium]